MASVLRADPNNTLLGLVVGLLSLLGFGLYPTQQLHAQDASLQGIVTHREGGQPLAGANIVLRSLANAENVLGTATDNEGFYSIGSIAPGTWTLRISFIGFEAYADTLVFRAGTDRTVSVELRPDDAFLDEVVVEQRMSAARREGGRQRISPVDLTRIPGPTAGDLVTYLQTLPGVVATGDRGGQVFIRGGTPSQNMVLVDGAMIYQPAHIVGFYSPFPEDLVAGADFYAGGFGPRYTGRISSVLDIQMRHGDRRNHSGSASVSPFSAEVFAEGPFVKGQSSWVLSVRNSLIEQSSGWYPIEEQPLKFQSQFLKGSYIERNSRCSAMAMHTYDRGRLDFQEDESVQWRNLVVGGKCVALPEGSRVLMDTNVSLSYFTNSVKDAGPFAFSSNATRLNFDLNLRQYSGDVRFDYGLYTKLKYLNFDLDEKFVGLENDSFSELSMGAYIESVLPVGDRLRLQPGVALSLNPGGYGVSPEPRFRFSWQPFGREREEVTGALGLYRQSIVGISDMRDLSSVFVAWMSTPIGDSQMEAIHALLGWQQTLADGLTWSVEGYHKRMRNLPVPVWSTIARFTTDLALADGVVYGSDFRIEYNKGRFYGLLGYGYSWTLYESAQDHFNVWFGEPVQEYHPPHDRRHQVNALFSMDIGAFTVGARWQLGTGFSFTRPLGFDDLLDFRERLPDVNQDRGIRRVILDKPYTGRLPTVHRLDLSLERSFRLGGYGPTLNLQAGAINVYDQTNIFYYDVFTQRRINQLPVVPYLTVEMEVSR
ncbi:MAG: TonB-dependent receptor [Balneolaceae bacterium]|nr:TonB-dependent receptor [Balneolaceae bacterium]